MEDLSAKIIADLASLKESISNIPQLELAEHNEAFEEIHNLLQQALSNLDGV